MLHSFIERIILWKHFNVFLYYHTENKINGPNLKFLTYSDMNKPLFKSNQVYLKQYINTLCTSLESEKSCGLLLLNETNKDCYLVFYCVYLLFYSLHWTT